MTRVLRRIIVLCGVVLIVGAVLPSPARALDVTVIIAGIPASIPEIDGGALGQGAVILLALWLMLRRRRAMV